MQKKLNKIRNSKNKCTELKNDVMYLESLMTAHVSSIWGDEILQTEFQKLLKLDVDERRLYLVYILLNQSIIKTAKYFQVDRKTVSILIKEIKKKLEFSS